MKTINRKHFIRFTAILLSSLLGTTSYAVNQGHTLTLINHYSQSLSFLIGINSNVLPGLRNTFSLPVNEDETTPVVDTGKQAIITVHDKVGNSSAFSVKIVANQVRISNLRSNAIAFTWTKKELTFCTLAEFNERGTCNSEAPTT